MISNTIEDMKLVLGSIGSPIDFNGITHVFEFGHILKHLAESEPSSLEN